MHQLAKKTEQTRFVESAPKPYNSYGPGAEARLRQEEGRRMQARSEVQESEMRLRLMEQEKIRQRQQATVLAQQQMRLRDERSPKRSPFGSPRPPSTLSNPPVAKQTLAGQSKNPFEGSDDGYDTAKDPFASDDTSSKKQPSASNPFEEYDSSLDPFAE